MNLRVTHAACLLALLLLAAPAQAQQEKLAQTGFKFLSVSMDSRGAAMGDALTASEGGSEMLFYNPAGLARQSSFIDIALAQTQWIADINYNAATMTFAPSNGRFGVFGFSVMAVDYGSLKGTIRADNEQGFIDIGSIEPTASAIGIGYARALTDRFSIGAHAKYATQDLGEGILGIDESDNFVTSTFKESVWAFDFGMLYKTGFRSLNFAVSARNFSEEIEYEEESFQLPLTVKIGLSMDMIDFTTASKDMHSFVLAVDAENPRDFSEQIKIGGEYVFMKMVALRFGYIFPTDEQGINLGIGFKQKIRSFGFGADYAYTDFGVFSDVHRLSFHLSL